MSGSPGCAPTLILCFLQFRTVSCMIKGSPAWKPQAMLAWSMSGKSSRSRSRYYLPVCREEATCLDRKHNSHTEAFVRSGSSHAIQLLTASPRSTLSSALCLIGGGAILTFTQSMRHRQSFLDKHFNYPASTVCRKISSSACRRSFVYQRAVTSNTSL